MTRCIRAPACLWQICSSRSSESSDSELTGSAGLGRVGLGWAAASLSDSISSSTTALYWLFRGLSSSVARRDELADPVLKNCL